MNHNVHHRLCPKSYKSPYLEKMTFHFHSCQYVAFNDLPLPVDPWIEDGSVIKLLLTHIHNDMQRDYGYFHPNTYLKVPNAIGEFPVTPIVYVRTRRALKTQYTVKREDKQALDNACELMKLSATPS